MAPPGPDRAPKIRHFLTAIAACAAMVSCAAQGTVDLSGGPYPPGLDKHGKAADNIQVANRLMKAEEYELALEAFTRAALDHGMTAEIQTGLGTANLGLGRLGQAERQLRKAVELAPDWPEAWNNLGVVLMEKGKTPEAQLVFRKAYALDNGESDAIRDNLRLALAKSENPAKIAANNNEYKLVRRGSSDYLIRKTP